MSYELFITRKEFYIDEEGEGIQQEQFEESIKGDDFMKQDENEYFWKGNPNPDLGDVSFWYEKDFGAISSKNPEEATIHKMYEIAQKLHAKVQGEDGEIYNADGVAIPEE
jgi:hypothetical protein